MASDFCFCTLAVGKRYRTHAQMLASDIQQHSLGTTFVILTDQPADFRHYSRVIAFKHRLKSVMGYHDKRFVLEKALELFDTCIFLDADIRILGPVPTDMQWLPGITVRIGYNILKHNAGSNPRKALPVIEKVAQKLDIDLQETKFLQECIFTLRKQAGAEIKFLRLWKTLSYVFEMQGIYAGEGNVMGLAAAKVGLTVRCDKQDRFPMFKDNMEKERIRKGRSNLQDKYTYFKIHREIEYPQCSILRKVMDGLKRKVVVLYRWLRLRYMANQDPEFKRLV